MMQTQPIPHDFQITDQPGSLTGQQKAIAFLLASGLSNKSIGSTIHRSPNTVKDHIERLMAEFGVNSRAALVAQLFCHGILQPLQNSTKTLSVFALAFTIGVISPMQDQHELATRTHTRTAKTARIARAGKGYGYGFEVLDHA